MLALPTTRFDVIVSIVDSPCFFDVASQYRWPVYEFHQSCAQPAFFFDLNLLLTFPSSDFSSPILLHKSFRSSSALFLAILAATSFL